MKQKELKNFAKQIVEAEKIIKANEDKQKVYQAQQKVMDITNRLDSLDDILLLDELVQEVMDKNS